MKKNKPALEPKPARHAISTLNEKPLHAALKTWYAKPGDDLEVPLAGSQIDIVRGKLLIEIQTANFTAIRKKIDKLLSKHPIRLVYPVAAEKWIVRVGADGHTVLGRRRSPKRGIVEHIFQELVFVPHLLIHKNFSLEVLLIREEEIRQQHEGRAWRRRGWVTCERRLIEVTGSRLFETPPEMAALLPDGLKEPFTTLELSKALVIPRWLAQKMTYCLRVMDVIAVAGKRGNAILYVRKHETVTP